MSRDILSGLPDATRGEILSFMTFFKGERARTLEALDGDFEDCLEDRIRGVDPPFSLEDVTSAVDHLQVVVKDGVERDLKKIVNMNVLLLKNLLATAQQRGVRLRVDTSVIEDEALLRQVDALKLTGGSFSPAEPKGPSASFDDLTSKEEQKALERTNDRLVQDNTTLQKDLRRLQAQSEQAARDQADLADEVRRLRKELRASSRSQAEAKDDEVERLSSRLRDAEDGLEAKLTSSRQFSDLKRQLQKKNELVSDLRARLRRAGLDDDALTADDRVRR